jgi:phenylacetate-CoA ligase
VEVRSDAGAAGDLREHLEQRLKTDLGVKVAVELVAEGSLAERTNLGREGKAKRLLDRRFSKKA